MEVNSLQNDLKDFDYLRLTWSDLHGIARCRVIPKHNLSQQVEGFGIWNGANTIGVRGELAEGIMARAGTGNMVVKPVPGTVHHIPWACQGDPSYKVGEVLCETYFAATGKPQGSCSRYLVRQQVDRLKKLTGLEIYSSYEAEFMLYDKATKKRLYDYSSLCSNLELSLHEKLLYDIERYLYQSGIITQQMQLEYAGSQFEYTFEPQFGVAAAEQMFLFKQAVKQIVIQRGLIATFMPKLDDGLGNGLHLNMSLWRDGCNVLYNPDSKDELSETGKHWVAGLIKHMPALTAFSNPTPNCYRRLNTPWVPSEANWEYTTRLACIRVRTEDCKKTIIENRLASGFANPYLVLAATIAAGLDGILNKLECPPTMDPAATKLPASLSESVKALQNDTVITEALGEELVSWWSTMKQQNEIEIIENITDDDKRMAKEMEQYFEVM